MATLLIAIGLSALAFGYGVQSVIHDLGALHVQHPDWPGHARMHVVWMLVLSFMLGSLVVCLAWWPSPRRARNLVLAAGLNVLPFASFVAAWAAISMYGGSISDGTAADTAQAQSNATGFALGLPLSLGLLAWSAYQLRRQAQIDPA